MTKSEDDATTTFGLVRKNLALIVIIIAGVATWTETRLTVANHSVELQTVRQFFAPDKLKDFYRWQINVERDIKELQAPKVCK